MSRPHENDISIGQDEWISFVDIGDQQLNAVNIDHLIAPIECFLSRLQTECIAECCGINAFSFWPENIHRASAGSDIQSLVQNLATLRNYVLEHESDVCLSTFLNQLFHRTVMIQILDHIMNNLTPGVQVLATKEGLTAHRAGVEVRMKGEG